MKKNIFIYILLIFSAVSCFKKAPEIFAVQKNDYAVGFSLEKKNDQWDIVSAGEKISFPVDFEVKRCIITGTSASAYIDALGKFNTIVGVCSPNYFYNPKIPEGIKNQSIEDVGNNTFLNFEKILALKPDLIIAMHNASYEKILNQLSKTGIKVVYIEEYNELHPLGKTEYLKLFGILFHETQKADSLYNSVKNNYLSLKEKTNNMQKKPTVFTGIMYGDSWYMAGGKSFISTLFSDAGADYLWTHLPETGTVSLSFEEVFSRAKTADYWIGASNFNSKKEMFNSNSHYQWFDACKNDRVYAMNGRENEQKANDYYEAGTIYADKSLADVIKILYPNLLPDYHLTYLRKLE
ncbi:MAG: ABC transporter substrate-binding protein [Flavobacteriaceae bacterium]|jgi:iron complex transport system substrate-binding protein|nr:ABC transporter substrate-binding protein [Flavobacteriaceae bacterium]